MPTTSDLGQLLRLWAVALPPLALGNMLRLRGKQIQTNFIRAKATAARRRDR